MIDSIGAQDHIADLTAKVKNLTLTAVHQQDWQHSTTTAVLTAVLPVLILSIIAARAVAAWKFCGPSICARARTWNNYRKRQRQPYNLYVKRRRWRNPPPTPELMEEAGSNPSIDLPPPEAPEETTGGIPETVLKHARSPSSSRGSAEQRINAGTSRCHPATADAGAPAPQRADASASTSTSPSIGCLQ